MGSGLAGAALAPIEDRTLLSELRHTLLGDHPRDPGVLVGSSVVPPDHHTGHCTVALVRHNTNPAHHLLGLLDNHIVLVAFLHGDPEGVGYSPLVVGVLVGLAVPGYNSMAVAVLVGLGVLGYNSMAVAVLVGPGVLGYNLMAVVVLGYNLMAVAVLVAPEAPGYSP